MRAPLKQRQAARAEAAAEAEGGLVDPHPLAAAGAPPRPRPVQPRHRQQSPRLRLGVAARGRRAPWRPRPVQGIRVAEDGAPRAVRDHRADSGGERGVVRHADLKTGDCLFPGRPGSGKPMTTRHYARLMDGWVGSIGLDPALYGTHSLRRTKVVMIHRRTGSLRAVQLLPGHRNRRARSATWASRRTTRWRWRSRSTSHKHTHTPAPSRPRRRVRRRPRTAGGWHWCDAAGAGGSIPDRDRGRGQAGSGTHAPRRRRAPLAGAPGDLAHLQAGAGPLPFVERDVGRAAHVRRAMPVLLTLRDGDGNALTNAPLPP